MKNSPHSDAASPATGKTLACLVVACVLTYVSPLRTPFDTQPYALLFATVALLAWISKERVGALPTRLACCLLVAVAATLMWGLGGGTLVGARSLAGYATFALVAVLAYWSSDQRLGRTLPILVAIMGTVALIQSFVHREFLAQLLPRLATSDGRGVTSLTPEPSIYAIECVALLVMNAFCVSRGDYSTRVFHVTRLALFGQIALAGSALGFVLLLAYLLISELASGKFMRALMGTTVTAFAAMTVAWLSIRWETVSDSRFSNLVRLAMRSPEDVLIADQSVAERAFAIEASVRSLAMSGGFGHGVGEWATAVPDIVARFPSLGRYGVSLVGQDRIMSGFGTAVFELGLIGLLIPASVVSLLIVRRADLSTWQKSTGGFLALAMATSMPLAFPLFGLLFGLAITKPKGKQLRRGARGEGVNNLQTQS